MQEKVNTDKKSLEKLGIENFKVGDPKFQILEPKELYAFLGEEKRKVFEYVARTYGKRIPGLSHLDHIIGNPEKVDKSLKDGSRYYILGCRDPIKDFFAVYVIWNGEEKRFLQRTATLTDAWSENEKILLMPRT